MSSSHFRFKLGKFDCAVVSDGTLKVPGPASAVPKGEPDMQNGEMMDVLVLFVDTGAHKILIDTGCGDLFQAGTGKLAANLSKAGIRADSIDAIIHTHGHLDHVAGSFLKPNEPAFPRARYFASEAEWDCWVRRPEREELRGMFTAARECYLPNRQQFTLVADGEEALPGVRLNLAPGHTAGSVTVKLSSGDKSLVCIGDLIHSAREFAQPDYYAFLDYDPEQAVANRNRVLADLAQKNQLAFVCHFPFPGLGRFVAEGKSFRWQPAEKI